MLNSLKTLQYPKFKLAIVLLLGVNIALYALTDTLTNTVDEVAWLSLLVLYELEANNIAIASEAALNKARDALIVVIVLVFLSYASSQEWLDIINSLLWFGIIALLEAEVRSPDLVVAYPKTYKWTKFSVFGGLMAMVAVWAWRKEWLDTYDAALWIVAFFTIESDVHQFSEQKAS